MIWTKGKLEKFLNSNNIDINQWGKGMSKTLDHLFNELIKGECELKVENNKLVRYVKALSIRVYYKDEKLIEEYQKMKDGRFRRRILDCSVAEKLTKYDKDLTDAVCRALEEELGIKNIEHSQVTGGKNIKRFHANSEDFPGISMDLELYRYDVTLKYDQYHPYGYIEHQEDKDIFFTWVKMKNKTN